MRHLAYLLTVVLLVGTANAIDVGPQFAVAHKDKPGMRAMRI